jgi:periplasmic divalent cation tolerance protein
MAGDMERDGGPMGFVELRTTLDDRRRAGELVRAVLEARLAACGQIVGPIESTYWWKRSVEVSQEWALVFKTTASLAPELRDFIIERHPYEVPEVVVFEIAETSDEYGEWIRRETK